MVRGIVVAGLFPMTVSPVVEPISFSLRPLINPNMYQAMPRVTFRTPTMAPTSSPTHHLTVDGKALRTCAFETIFSNSLNIAMKAATRPGAAVRMTIVNVSQSYQKAIRSTNCAI